MQKPEIFSATLGLSHPWQITTVTFAKEGKRLDISIVYSTGKTLTCPICGVEGKCCAEEKEVWVHENFFQFETYLHVKVPRIACVCCGTSPVERPWSRAGSRFTMVQ
jgi:transposase